MGQLIRNFKKYRYLLGELIRKNIKLRYRRSYLGLLWTLIEPLLTMIVLTIVFEQMLGKGGKDPNIPFPVYVLTGRLLYSAFSGSTNAAMKSIRGNSGMIKKVYVPKYMYPLSGIISNFVIFLLSLIVLVAVIGVFVIMGKYKAPVNWETALILVPLLNLLLLSVGVGLVLSTLCVFFRDIEYLWSVLLMLIMYCSAIFYYAKNITNPSTMILLKVNPVFGIIDNFRRSLFGWGIDYNLMLYSFGVSIIILIIGLYLFYRRQDDFILNI
jgi:ABC-2 type transport system permease protein